MNAEAYIRHTCSPLGQDIVKDDRVENDTHKKFFVNVHLKV